MKEKALKLLLNWAIECGFGYDNILDEYEKYKDEIEEMDYTEGLIYIAEREVERMANKPIRIDGVTEKCPKCGEKVMYAVGTGFMFHGASESYEDWRVIKHDYCPKCGIKIEREGAE